MPYAARSFCPRGVVRGSVIMKKRKTRISGDVSRTDQRYAPAIGPRCQRAAIVCPVAASTATPRAKVHQNATARPSSFRRPRIRLAPPTMIANANPSHGDIGPHQKSSGSARPGPSRRKQRTRPKFDGLKMCRPPTWITCFESRDTAAVPA